MKIANIEMRRLRCSDAAVAVHLVHPVPHLDLWVGLPTTKISIPLCVTGTYTPNLVVLC